MQEIDADIEEAIQQMNSVMVSSIWIPSSAASFKLLSRPDNPAQGCSEADINSVNSEALYEEHMENILYIDLIKANKIFCPHLDCTVQGSTKFFALNDTGADVSCMSMRTFREILIDKQPPKKKKPMLIVRGASNQILESVGHYDFNLVFQDGKTGMQEFIVFKELNTGLILGMDFITDHALTFLPT